jgi:SNF2 family DNA or RNA helicase
MADTRAIISTHAKEIFVPDDERLRALVPSDWRYVRHPQLGQLLALPHSHDVTRLCRNLGYTVPAPIVNHYKWPSNPKPFKTQQITAALLTMNDRAYVLSEMGTGKTRAALYACDYLFQCNDIKHVLVVAPLSTLSQVWDKEIYGYFGHLSSTVLYGDRDLRHKRLRENHHFYIINHDGISTCLKALLEKKFDVVIIDEIGAFRNTSTDRWKNMFAVASKAPYAWGMTGSPTPNAPTDAWGIAKMLTPARTPRSIKAFQRETMVQVSQFRWIAKSDANDKVYALLQPAVRYKRDDCVELPDVSYQTIKVPQSKEITDVYDTMIKKLTTMFKEGTVNAANEGVLFMKLLQIASGWVYTSNRGVVCLDNKKRIAELLDIIDQALGKVIVFADFKHAAHAIHEALLKAKIDCSLVTGDTSKTHRDDIFGCFQNGPSPHVLVAHPKCMAHGLTLTEANTIIWFTPTVSLETYEQANARITRPGQVRKSLIIHLTGSPIESKIYSRLQHKAKVQGALLDMFNDN